MEIQDIKAFFILDQLVMPSLQEFHSILTHPHTESHFRTSPSNLVNCLFNIALIEQLCQCCNLQIFHLNIIGTAHEADFTDDQPIAWLPAGAAHDGWQPASRQASAARVCL
jgi:hypothetical protein